MNVSCTLHFLSLASDFGSQMINFDFLATVRRDVISLHAKGLQSLTTIAIWFLFVYLITSTQMDFCVASILSLLMALMCGVMLTKIQRWEQSWILPLCKTDLSSNTNQCGSLENKEQTRTPY